jgi:hypothetical protein
VAIAIGALSAGYCVGFTVHPRKPTSSSGTSTSSKAPPRAENIKVAASSDKEISEASSDEDTEVSRLELLPSDECKLVGIILVTGIAVLESLLCVGARCTDGFSNVNRKNCSTVSEEVVITVNGFSSKMNVLDARKWCFGRLS